MPDPVAALCATLEARGIKVALAVLAEAIHDAKLKLVAEQALGNAWQQAIREAST